MTHSSGADIANYLSTQEKVIASLYAAFSVTLPNMQAFWQKLVKEENAHAEVVGQLADLCRSDDVYFNENKFNIEAIKTHIAYIQKRTKETMSGGITPIQALSMATDIENGRRERITS